MKRLLRVLFACILSQVPLAVLSQTSAFIYQGRLNSSGTPVNGSFDFTFTLYPSSSGGSAVAGTSTNSAVGVSNGLFTTSLDFGANVYNGQALWLEVGVCTNGAGTFSTLAPRQPLSSTPYAVQSLNASSASIATTANSVFASNISGPILNSSLPTNPVFAGPVTGQSFIGNGNSLTNLNFRLNDTTMFLRSGSDMNNGLGWYGSSKTFAGLNVDGPVLFGFSGGVLGLNRSSQIPVLNWDGSGNVGIGVTNPQARLDVNGTVNSFALNSSSLSASTINAGFYQNLSASYLVNLTNPTVVAWGSLSLSDGATIVPTEFASPTAHVRSVAAGDTFGLALRTDGTVAAWGNNSYGQTNVPASLFNVIAIAAGGGHCLALKSNGTVVAWGKNDSFQATVPAGLTNVVAISAGASHSVALKSDGTLVAWGDNSAGQTNVPALKDFAAISAGVVFSAALRSNGTVVAWGDPLLNELQTSALTGVAAISTGFGNGLALHSNGTVTVWGAGSYTPPPGGLSNIVAVSLGASAMALRSDGTLVCWGGPTPPLDLHPVIALAPGPVAGFDMVIEQNSSPVPFLNGDNTFNGNVQVNGTLSGSAISATSLSGDGSGVSNVAVTVSGLPPDVALVDSNQTFTASNHFGADVGVGGSAYFGSSERQMLNLYSTNYGVGVQNTTEYFRTGGSGGFAWFKGGMHTNTAADPGPGGTLLMKLGTAGYLTATGFVGDASLLTNVPGSQVTGPIPSGSLPSSGTFGALTVTNLTAGSVSGNGAGLTNLNASQLASGTVPNSVLSGFQSPYTTISGGVSNGWVSGSYTTIGGGSSNSIAGFYATIGGGQANGVAAGGATIAGGQKNTNTANAGFIGGGQNNSVASGNQPVITGGYGNSISAAYSDIGGGYGNSVTGDYSSLGGGNQNGASAIYTTVGGGNNNNVYAKGGTISGGVFNTVTNSAPTTSGWAVISGGANNNASGTYATIPGGSLNIASGNYTFAAGNNAQATNDGAFVWSDGTGTATTSVSNNSVTFRASGGYRFITSTGAAGAQLTANATAWSTLSDRNAKKNFQSVDTVGVLNKLVAVPLSQWNYKWEKDNDVPNIGPMAQDFKNAFYPGRDDKGITTLEFDGVELAAIQGLNRKLENTIKEKDAQITALQKRLERLEKLVEGSSGLQKLNR